MFNGRRRKRSKPLSQTHPPQTAVERLRSGLERADALRIGDTTVLSPFIHILRSDRPGTVFVATAKDAGRTLYAKQTSRSLLHLDIFHQNGEVDHRRVAAACIGAVKGSQVSDRAADDIDLQTATGGGRITGALTFGKGRQLRRAHHNHVHLVFPYRSRMIPLTFALVNQVESVILEHGLGLRRIEQIATLDANESDQWLNREMLSDYVTEGDSHLTGPQGASAVSRQTRAAARCLANTVGLPGLKDLTRGGTPRRQQLQQLNQQQCSSLQDAGLLKQTQGPGFTDKGRRALNYLQTHQHELKLMLRKSMKMDHSGPLGTLEHPEPGGQGTKPRPLIRPVSRTRPVETLAVQTTVKAALIRNPQRLSIRASDLHHWSRRRRRPIHLCLLIDASASMAGERLDAARFLVRRLLSVTRDRVGVLTFQEHEVKVRVPFTRRLDTVETGLEAIEPFGLTPLAQALIEADRWLSQQGITQTLVLLITDGIPTVPLDRGNPLDDALEAAASLGKGSRSFACIGLQPNEDYLARLAREADGRLYAVGELEPGTLAEIAERERARL